MTTALVLSDSWLARNEREFQRRYPVVGDERAALRLGQAFMEGASLVSGRLAHRLFGGAVGTYGATAQLQRALEPDYADVRNYLEHDCRVYPTIAAKVALALTRELVRLT